MTTGQILTIAIGGSILWVAIQFLGWRIDNLYAPKEKRDQTKEKS